MIYKKAVVFCFFSLFNFVFSESCEYRCYDKNHNLISGIQNGAIAGCKISGCHGCNFFGANCDYCKFGSSNNRDISGVSLWCYDQGGDIFISNCDEYNFDIC